MARDLASDPGADLSKTGDDVREALKNGRAALLRGRMGSDCRFPRWGEASRRAARHPPKRRERRFPEWLR